MQRRRRGKTERKRRGGDDDAVQTSRFGSMRRQRREERRPQRPHGRVTLPAMLCEKGGEHGVERGDANPTVVELKAGDQRLRSNWPEKDDVQEARERSILSARWMKLESKRGEK